MFAEVIYSKEGELINTLTLLNHVYSLVILVGWQTFFPFITVCLHEHFLIGPIFISRRMQR